MIEFLGETWNLPPRGRFGCQIEYTLRRIMLAEKPIALYKAMGLRGRAQRYGAVYKAAFQRFARVNAAKLREGAVGPRGGYGFTRVQR